MIIYNSVNEESVLKDTLTQQPTFNIKQKGALKMQLAPLIILQHVSLIGSVDHKLEAMELKFCTGMSFMFLDLP